MKEVKEIHKMSLYSVVCENALLLHNYAWELRKKQELSLAPQSCPTPEILPCPAAALSAFQALVCSSRTPVGVADMFLGKCPSCLPGFGVPPPALLVFRHGTPIAALQDTAQVPPISSRFDV